MPPSRANAAPVVRLVAPGPSVVRHTPGLPVRRPYVAAMNAAGCSCRVTTSSMLRLAQRLEHVEVLLAGHREDALDTFCCKAATNSSAPFCAR